VIGGKNSANTKRLASVCSKITRTRHVEDASEIRVSWFKGLKRTGIITGASTPGEFIGDAVKKIKELYKTAKRRSA
jgi:4-hydroxy-3-methylbut-2-enyl diphosphate reductase